MTTFVTRIAAATLLATLHPLAAGEPPQVAPTSAALRDHAQAGVGGYLPDATATPLNGYTPVSWRQGKGDLATVIAFTSVTCPMCQRVAGALAAAEETYASKGVRFVYVNVSGTDSSDQMRSQIASHGFKGLYLVDSSRTLAATLGAETTAEILVVDRSGTLRYRGAANDQYGLAHALERPKRDFLAAAIDAAIAGNNPETRATTAPGCLIEPPDAKKLAESHAPTYSREIARFMQERCLECHREGGVGPFRLDSFEAVSKRAAMIESVVSSGTMPPWFAHAAKDGDGPSLWRNDRTVSEREKRTLSSWIAAGKPEGDVRDLPMPRGFEQAGWTIGTPDAVFQIPEAIDVKADGVMPYQYAVVPTRLEADRWVQAMQIVPGEPSVVHHVLVYAVPEGAFDGARLRDRSHIDEGRGFFAAYVPGNDSVTFPAGFAKALPKQTRLLFQIHYTPNGTPRSDRLKLGVVYARQEPEHAIRTIGISNHRFVIPAGEANHEVRADLKTPTDAVLLAFMPHMHVRGKAFRYDLEQVGGGSRTLLDIPRYDFNWQLRYELQEPVSIAKGDTIHAFAWYDNSEGNAANPDPTKAVRWGPQTTDEMMLGYVEYYLVDDAEDSITFDRLLARFDADHDGVITRTEVPALLRKRFDRLDRDKSGTLTRDDFAK